MKKSLLNIAVMVGWVWYPSLWLLPVTALWLWYNIHGGAGASSQPK